MDFSFDIYEIYRQFCDITSRGICNDGEVCSPDDEIQKVSTTREALAQLLKVVETKISSRVSILEEVYKLMLRLDLMADFSEFKRFYDFVFFICRENGQKNITVSRAIMAWRLVLAGRFRLLNQWCNFVEKNQRHNISVDTWRQVLAFSRCVHENLEGYDPEGAWPVLIDDFVEYMYRIMGTPGTPNIFCNCGDSESQQCEESLSGLKNFPGSKRKWGNNFQQMEVDSSDGYCSIANSKRRLPYLIENNENFKHSNNNNNNNYNNQLSCSKSSPCAVEGCLSKGFAGLLSGRSCLQFNHDTRVSYT